MNADELLPGTWPTMSKSAYARLVRLAERRLSGQELAAEDVVMNAFIKWTSIHPGKRDIARVEQVIKSEAASWRRSEQRRRAREANYATDPTRCSQPPTTSVVGLDLVILLDVLEQTATRRGIVVDSEDRTILGLLLDGMSISEVARKTNKKRHSVKKSRERWQLIWRLAVGVDWQGPLFGHSYRR